MIPNGDLLVNSVEKFNVDNGGVIYKFELIISRQNIDISVQVFKNRLYGILNNINGEINSTDTKIFCKNIEKENMTFLFKLNLNLNKVEDIDSIKNLINIELINKLNINNININFLD